MPTAELSRDNAGSPYAQQLAKGFANLKFMHALEKEFRQFYVAQILPRGRRSSQVALILVVAIASVEFLFGAVSGDDTTQVIRFAVLCPLLLIFSAALYVPALKRFYIEIAAVGVTVIGIIVTYMALSAAINGASYMLAAIILVNLYACLFLGLRFYQAAAIAGSLVLAHFVTAYAVNLPFHEFFYSSAMLCSTAVIGTFVTYSLEHALRTNFLETRLLNELAERDGLTGLYNRRIFDDYIQRVWRQSRREGLLVEIIFIDIDYFKIYNDLYGHQHGDDCLKQVARTIASYAKRPFDFCARYGGEEFVLVLYGPPSEHGLTVPERIRQDVLELGIPHEGSAVASTVTVSVGVALARPDSGRSLAGAIQVADEALYEAKRTGRNRAVLKDANESDAETGNFRAPFKELA